MAHAARGAGPRCHPSPVQAWILGSSPRMTKREVAPIALTASLRSAPLPPRRGEQRRPTSPAFLPVPFEPNKEEGAAPPPPTPLPPRSGERWPAKRVGEGVGRDGSRLPQRRHPRASEAKRSATLGSMPEWHMPRGALATPPLAISDVWPSLRSTKPSRLLSPPQGGR